MLTDFSEGFISKYMKVINTKYELTVVRKGRDPKLKSDHFIHKGINNEI